MALKSMVMEFGMGTDIRGADYTKAAVRAAQAAIHQNTIMFAPAFGIPYEQMQIKIHIGAGRPEQVDKAAVAGVLPYGNVTVSVAEGGMDIPKDDGSDVTILANAAVTVFLDLPAEERVGEGA